MADNYDDLQQSFGRCLRNKDFIARFYEIFLASHPDIAPMFAKTDFAQQRLALRRGISVAISFAAGSNLVNRTVEQMAHIHSRKGRTPVPPPLYPYWIESLLQTVRENDSEASPALMLRWSQAMQQVVNRFSKDY